MWVSKIPLSMSQTTADSVVRALDVPSGGAGTYTSEVYVFQEQEKLDFCGLARPRVFWVVRRLVAFLGGHNGTNFVATSIEAWANKLAKLLGGVESTIATGETARTPSPYTPKLLNPSTLKPSTLNA